MKSELALLLTTGESERTEFQATRASVESIGREVCGLLNQQGGVLLWGVDDNGHVAGVANADVLVVELNKHLVRHLNPRPLFSVSVAKVSHNEVVVVDVAPGADKPYSYGGEIWVRVGAKTLRAGADRSAEIVGVAAATLARWERSTAPGFEISDCDVEELATARREIERTGRFGVDVPQENEEFLRRLYVERNGQFTNAAVVLFARDPQVWAPNLAVRVVSYAGDKSGSIGNEAVVVGPAVRVLREVVAIVQQRTGFSGQFHKSRLSREDRPAYPVFALREGLVNALVHRDYTAVGGQVRVEVFPDRLTISNPGRLPVGILPRDLYRRHESAPINPDIARVFYLRELMERLGMGTQRLVAACVELGAKKPVWEVRQGSVWLTLFRAPAPEPEHQLAGRQQEFLAATGPAEDFSASDYARIAHVSLRQARRDLADLQMAGLVHRSGEGRATKYRRAPKGSQ